MKGPRRLETKKWRILISDPTSRREGKRPVLAVAEPLWKQMRASIFPDRRLERGGYLFGRRRRGGGRQVFEILEFLPAAPEDILRQGSGVFSVRAEFHARALNRFAAGAFDAVWEVHSHPFCRWADFSPIDNQSFPEFTHIWSIQEGKPHVLRLVLGADESGFCCELWERESGTSQRVPVMLIERASQAGMPA